jgi:hypothetical protein
LRQERIDRANLNAMTTARVAKRRGFYVIGSIRYEEGKCGEPIQDLLTRFWSREALEAAAALCSTFVRQVTILSDYESPIARGPPGRVLG